MGAEALSGAAFCTGGNGWHSEHPGKYQPGTGTTVGHPALQLPVPDRMHLPGTFRKTTGITHNADNSGTAG